MDSHHSPHVILQNQLPQFPSSTVQALLDFIHCPEHLRCFASICCTLVSAFDILQHIIIKNGSEHEGGEPAILMQIPDWQAICTEIVARQDDLANLIPGIDISPSNEYEEAPLRNHYETHSLYVALWYQIKNPNLVDTYNQIQAQLLLAEQWTRFCGENYGFKYDASRPRAFRRVRQLIQLPNEQILAHFPKKILTSSDYYHAVKELADIDTRFAGAIACFLKYAYLFPTNDDTESRWLLRPPSPDVSWKPIPDFQAEKTKPFLCLPVPQPVADIINRYIKELRSANVSHNLSLFLKKNQDYLDAVQNFLSKINRDHGTRLTEDRIASYLFDRLLHQEDSDIVTSMLATGRTHYTGMVPLHYTFVPLHTLQQHYRTVCAAILADQDLENPESDRPLPGDTSAIACLTPESTGAGSKVCPRHYTVGDVSGKLKKTLRQAVAVYAGKIDKDLNQLMNVLLQGVGKLTSDTIQINKLLSVMTDYDVASSPPYQDLLNLLVTLATAENSTVKPSSYFTKITLKLLEKPEETLKNIRQFIHLSTRLGNDATASRLQLRELQNKFQRMNPWRHRNLDNLVKFHNRMAIYTSAMLGFATGYRAILDPFPKGSSLDRESGFLVINDKDYEDLYHSRIVWLPPDCIKQIDNYHAHLGAFLDQIMLYDLDTFHNIKSQIEGASTGPTLFLLRENLGQIAVGKSRQEAIFRRNLEYELPANANRHYLRSSLLSLKCPPEVINAFLGHWERGCEPWGYYSALTPETYRENLKTLLLPLLERDGWEAVAGLGGCLESAT